MILELCFSSPYLTTASLNDISSVFLKLPTSTILTVATHSPFFPSNFTSNPGVTKSYHPSQVLKPWHNRFSNLTLATTFRTCYRVAWKSTMLCCSLRTHWLRKDKFVDFQSWTLVCFSYESDADKMQDNQNCLQYCVWVFSITSPRSNEVKRCKIVDSKHLLVVPVQIKTCNDSNGLQALPRFFQPSSWAALGVTLDHRQHRTTRHLHVNNEPFHSVSCPAWISSSPCHVQLATSFQLNCKSNIAIFLQYWILDLK